MTDKKKISILERLLDDRDEQIRELQQKNMELEEMIESYKCIQDDMAELKNIIRETSVTDGRFCPKPSGVFCPVSADISVRQRLF